MNLNSAKDAFRLIMQQVSDDENRKQFLAWIDKTWIREDSVQMENQSSEPESNCLEEYSYKDSILQKIAEDLRNMMPINGILPSENITFPTVGENADCDPAHTLHVDAFLYDDDLVDELCDDGEIARNYCVECLSHNTLPINYVSHSSSRERIHYIFGTLLPPLAQETTLVDVGSRLGALLFGAYVFTKSSNIVGVELNDDLCKIQQSIVDKYSFQDRIRVISGDVQNSSEAVQVADVLIMNNVFEFFVPLVVQAQLWKFIRANTKRGSLIVSVPSLEDALRHLEVGFQQCEWVKEISPYRPNVNSSYDFQTETSEIKLYQVV